MQQYRSTPDYYRDYIEHGWLKDQAAKVHKYISRKKNAAGKWIYQYASDVKSDYVKNKQQLKNKLTSSEKREEKYVARKMAEDVMSGRRKTISESEGRKGYKRNSIRAYEAPGNIKQLRPKKRYRVTESWGGKRDPWGWVTDYKDRWTSNKEFIKALNSLKKKEKSSKSKKK